jgi:hypothetical protein
MTLAVADAASRSYRWVIPISLWVAAWRISSSFAPERTASLMAPARASMLRTVFGSPALFATIRHFRRNSAVRYG